MCIRDSYTTEQAEENDLQAGKIDIGTVDPGVLTSAAPAPGKVGANWANLASKYNLSTGTIWGFNYAPFNFNKKDAKVAAVDQLYIDVYKRQTLNPWRRPRFRRPKTEAGTAFATKRAIPQIGWSHARGELPTGPHRRDTSRAIQSAGNA